MPLLTVLDPLSLQYLSRLIFWLVDLEAKGKLDALSLGGAELSAEGNTERKFLK